MKSAAFIIIGLTIGILLTFVFFKSGLQISFNKSGPTPTPISSSSPVSASSTTPTATPAPGSVVQAGGKLSFVKYQISVPNTWTYQKKSQTENDETLTITNGQNKITIAQVASEGSVCVYPGDPDPGIPFKSEFKYFNAVTTADGTLLRRSGENANSTSFSICAYSPQNTNYQLPTMYGYITTNFPADQNTLKQQELDSILSSLKKI